jgi:ankyrin repeat protein
MIKSHTKECPECELSLACLNGEISDVAKIIAKGANVRSISYCNTALFDAISIGKYELVDLLLKKGADPNRVNPITDETPLWMAIDNSNDSITKKLIESGASLSSVSLNEIVSQSDDTGKIELALGCGIDIDSVDYETGRSALHVAVMYGYIDTVNFLLEKGANANIVDNWGKTPTDLAKTNSHIEIEKLILNKLNSQR